MPILLSGTPKWPLNSLQKMSTCFLNGFCVFPTFSGNFNIYIYTLALDHTFLSRPSVGPAAISILLATDIAGPTKDRIQGICPRIPSHGRMRFVENPTGFFFVAVLWLWRMGWLVLLRIVFLSMLFLGVVFFFSGWALFVKDWKLTFDPKNTCKSWCLSSICAVFSVAVEMPLNLKRSCNSSSCFTAITFSDSEPLGSMGEFHLWTLLRFEPFRIQNQMFVQKHQADRPSNKMEIERQPNRKKMKKENGTEY